MAPMWCDLKLAARLLAKNRLFTIAVIALLTCGVGVSTALFSLVDAILLRPLPVRDPGRLVRFVIQRPSLPPLNEFFYEEYKAWQKDATAFADLVAWSEQERFVRAGGATNRLRIDFVSENFFQALGTRPARGRLFGPDDETQTAVRPAVLSYVSWKRRFQGDPDILGRSIAIEGYLFTIVGITPEGFNGLTVETGPELRVPLSAANLWPSRLYEGHIECSVAGHLRHEVSIESARAQADSIREAVQRDLSGTVMEDLSGRFDLEPIERGISRMRAQFSSVLWILMSSLLLLLLMVCVNIAGLNLARASLRRSELAIRVALGAKRISLVRLLLTESILLMLGGAAGALVVSALLLPWIEAALPPIRDITARRLPLLIDLAIDWRVFGFAILLSTTALLIFGLGPAVMSLRRDVCLTLKEARVGGGWRGRDALVVTQVALAILLLAGAGLMLLSLRQLNLMDSGFAREGVVMLSIDASISGYSDQQDRGLRRRILTEARQLPGTSSAAIARRGLMRGTGLKITVARTGESTSEFLNSSTNPVTPGYFETLGIPLLAGRDLTDAEETASSQPEGRAVNHAFVRKFFPERDPIGQTFGAVQAGKGVAKPDFKVIGVVGNAHYRSLREPPPPIIYGPLRGDGEWILHVRSKAPSSMVIAAMTKALSGIDPDLAFAEVTTLDGEIEASLWSERFAAFVSTALAIAATLIASAGIYSVLAFTLQQSRREIGIRIALGAQRSSVVWLFGRRALILAGVGSAFGIGLVWLVAPRIHVLFYEVEPWTNWIIGAAVACISFFVLMGSLAPSLAAARTQPSHVLRSE